jgi:hypothetical protein
LQVALLHLHIGFAYFDEIQMHRSIQRDIAMLGILAHDLPVYLALRGHVDNDVALQLCLATQSATLRQRLAATLAVSLFRVTEW